MYGINSSTVSREVLGAVIAKCNLAETIAKLPKGLDTLVGERGSMLSGGERQKVSAADAWVARTEDNTRICIAYHLCLRRFPSRGLCSKIQRSFFVMKSPLPSTRLQSEISSTRLNRYRALMTRSKTNYSVEIMCK